VGLTEEIQVGVCRITSNVIQPLEEELSALGYRMHLNSDVPAESKPDIYIIDISELTDSQKSLENLSAPYIVAGINPSFDNQIPSNILENSVGYINGHPSIQDICIGIRLGLPWHKERELYTLRTQNINEKIRNNRINGVAIGMLMHKTGFAEQDVLDSLKSVSRRKQHRMVDTALEVIAHTNVLKSASLNSIAELEAWLDLITPCRCRK
jgi:hypothetical protein